MVLLRRPRTALRNTVARTWHSMDRELGSQPSQRLTVEAATRRSTLIYVVVASVTAGSSSGFTMQRNASSVVPA